MQSNTQEQAKPKTRLIHVRLPEELHKKVRIQAAETDKTIQDWVIGAIKEHIKRTTK